MATKKNIKMTRGDDYKFKFIRKDEEGHIITDLPSEIYFTIKEDAESSAKEVQYTYTDGDIYVDNDYWWHVHIKHADTANLEYGVHYYDVQFIESDEVHTRIQGKITLLSEYTWEPDQRN